MAGDGWINGILDQILDFFADFFIHDNLPSVIDAERCSLCTTKHAALVYTPTCFSVVRRPIWSSVGSAQQNHGSVSRGGRRLSSGRCPEAAVGGRPSRTVAASARIRWNVTAGSSSILVASSTSSVTA